MKKWACILCGIILMGGLVLASCQSQKEIVETKKSIVVTYSVLGSLVKDLVGDQANVTVSIPDGLDPHEWSPSAKDIEAINKADLVVQNGLNMEEGMEDVLTTAKEEGTKIFAAADYITIRKVGEGEGIPSDDTDQAVGADDPHLWMDPLTMKDVVKALAEVLQRDLNLDVSASAQDLNARLDDLNTQVNEIVSVLPQENRKLITGHESMGYFAQRYDFTLVGVIVPSLSSQAEVSAADLANLKQVIEENQVKAIFTELGTPKAVAEAISKETGVKVIELTTHGLPEDGTYSSFMIQIANTITDGLR